MPIVNLLASTASFLYAVSSMLSGAQNHGVVHQNFVSNFQSSPSPFLPVAQAQRSGKAVNYEAVGYNYNYNFSDGNAPFAPTPENNFINSNNNNNNFNDNLTGSGGSSQQANPNIKQEFSSTLYLPITNMGPNDQFKGPIEVSYHDGETIATLFTDYFGNVTRCELLEVNKISEQQEALANLAAQNKLIEKTNFNTMLNIIRACQALDKDEPRVTPANPIQAIVQRKANMWTIVSGILPGTKWCGLKDIADGWNDLGPEKALDKCCRSHDLCPRKVLAFRAAYGLVNWSFYTKSHCECDAALYDCLKRTSENNPTAELMGNFYFNVLRVQCVEEERPPRCLSMENNNSLSCTKWDESDESRENQRLVFREVKNMFR